MAPPIGYRPTKETIQKIKDALKGKDIGRWNIGRKHTPETLKKMSLAKKGKKFTDEHKNKISESKRGEKHPLWKGDRVGYTSLHQWVIRQKGKADKCLFCGSHENVEWANRDHKYKRGLNDWMPLCKKCHWKYDQASWGTASKLFIKQIGGGLGKRI